MTPPTFRPASLSAVARALGLPRDWLREQAESGRIPALLANDRWLFDLETVRRCILDRARCGDNPKEGPDAS